jgi:hypothetical protein
MEVEEHLRKHVENCSIPETLLKIRSEFSITNERKFGVYTEIGSTFFWFLTSYRSAEKVQNDYLSSA